MWMSPMKGVINIKENGFIGKLIALSIILVISLHFVIAVPALGQEEETEELPLSHRTSLFLTTGMDLVPSTSDVAGGSIRLPDQRQPRVPENGFRASTALFEIVEKARVVRQVQYYGIDLEKCPMILLPAIVGHGAGAHADYPDLLG